MEIYFLSANIECNVMFHFIISFFGFEGDRRIGIACLKHSRQSEDMRAPLAT